MCLSKKLKLCFALAAFLLAFGVAASVYQIVAGPGVSALSNGFVWGLYIALFELFVGVGGGCLFLHGLFRVRKYKPAGTLCRDAAIAGLAFIAAAGVMIMLDLGNIFHMNYMITNLNTSSPLAGDMVMMTLFVFVSLACIFVRGHEKVLAALAMLLGLAAPIVTSLIFSELSVRTWWHSVCVPAGFLFMGLASGAAVLILICASRSDKNTRKACSKDVAILMRIVTLMSLAFIVVELTHLLVACSNGTASLILSAAAPLFIVELILAIIAPVLFFLYRRAVIFPAAASIGAAVSLLLGDLIYRMTLLYAGLNALPLTFVASSGDTWSYPISTGIDSQSTFMSALLYVPKLEEWAVALLPLGIALAVFLLGHLFCAWLDVRADHVSHAGQAAQASH